MSEQRAEVGTRKAPNGWSVWCQAHVEWCAKNHATAFPLADGLTWNDAQKRLREANRECQDEPQGPHVILPTGETPHFDGDAAL